MSASHTAQNSERDPAASMSLLTHLLRNPLDAGYGFYTPAPARSRPRSILRRLFVLTVALLMGACMGVGIQGLRAHSGSSVHATLYQHAQAQEKKVAELQADLSDLTQQVTTAREQLLPSTGVSDESVLMNSTTRVHGPGLQVVLSDAPNAASLPREKPGRVRDQDLRMTINALWGAGAEAVSLNGIRIAPGTFIRTAGSAILVDITPVSSPYTVEAIGDASTLSVALVRGSTGDYLSSTESLAGISITTQSVRDLTLEARDLRTTRNVHPLSGE